MSELLGIDCCGKPIIPVRDKLSKHRNRHPNTNGTDWGWIDGCSLNICWSDDHNFNSTSAGELVQKYNAELRDRVAELPHPKERQR